MARRTVIVADDHEIIRSAVVEILLSIPDVDVVAEAEDGISAIAQVRLHSPDLLVTDAAMPLARGIEVFAETRRWSPKTRTILLTGFTSATLLSDWLEAGIDGLLLKTSAVSEMKTCFETVLEGGNFVSVLVQDILCRGGVPVNLTNREREVLALIARGHSNALIGERLSISPKTVEKHRGSLMAKLDVNSVSQLMVYALREGLLDEHKQL